ncbi:MAG TPA: FAD-dependent monooxygenase [Dyella sp.]
MHAIYRSEITNSPLSLERGMNPVLIVGAGPTGLAHALWLTAQGIAVRIIDRTAEPGTTSRAVAVQARTLELYRQLGLSETVVAAGHRNPAMNIWARGEHRARLAFQEAGSDVSPYPFILLYPQDFHERTLVDKLQTLGISVERQTELVSFLDHGDRIEATLRRQDGTEEIVESHFLSACDGASSTVRKQLNIGFEGGTYRQVFYVADVQLSDMKRGGEAHIALDGGDFVAVLSYGDQGEARLIGTVRDDRLVQGASLTFEDVGKDAINSLGVVVDQVHWFSHYRVHHRVADRFREGRVFLMGDAAHVHSPAGGQGMNTGILDAINLAWKFAAVLDGQASERLLESYAIERQAFARELVKTTDRVFTLMTAEGGFADVMRSYVMPMVASAIYKVRSARELLFRIVSQTSLAYADSPLSVGKAGHISGGERLPWVRTEGQDNYDTLTILSWQIHIYGERRSDVERWAAVRGIAVHVFPWTSAHAEAGFERDALYLLRPDTWVALASSQATVEALDDYCQSHELFRNRS